MLATYLKREWRSLFFSGYLGLLRAFVTAPPTTEDATSQIFLLPKNYAKKFLQFKAKFEDTLNGEREFRKTNKSEKICKMIDAQFDDYLKSWSLVMRPFLAFLLNTHASHLLSGTVFSEFPGMNSSEIRIPKNPEDAIRTLKQYVQLIVNSNSSAIDKSYFSLRIRIFYKLEKLLENFSVNNAVDSSFPLLQKIITESISLFRTANKYNQDMDRAKNGLLTHETWCKQNKVKVVRPKGKSEFTEFLMQNNTACHLAIAWLKDIVQIIEHAILPHIEPNYKPTEAYINRIAVNLVSLNTYMIHINLDRSSNDAFGKLILDDSFKKGSPSSPHFTILKTAMLLIASNSFIEAGNRLYELNKRGVQSVVYAAEHLRKLYNLLTPLIKDLSIALPILKNKAEEQCKGLPILEKSKWLAYIYILYHDLGVITGSHKAKEEEIFPSCYFELLDLEVLDDESPSPTELKELSSEDSPEPEEITEQTDTEEVVISTSEVVQTAVSTVFSLVEPPIRKPKPEVKESRRQTVSPQDLLKSGKLRYVKGILRRLGLEELRSGKGSHMHWKNPITNAQTTVSSHSSKEIPLGTRKAMISQLLGSATS